MVSKTGVGVIGAGLLAIVVGTTGINYFIEQVIQNKAKYLERVYEIEEKKDMLVAEAGGKSSLENLLGNPNLLNRYEALTREYNSLIAQPTIQEAQKNRKKNLGYVTASLLLSSIGLFGIGAGMSMSMNKKKKEQFC